jgi:hypothetical protein
MLGAQPFAIARTGLGTPSGHYFKIEGCMFDYLSSTKESSMNNTIRIALFFCYLIVSGCASGPTFVIPELSEDKVTIFAFRTSSMVGAANSDIVSVNDRFIGRLNSGTYTVFVTDPGPIIIKRKAGSALGKGKNVGWGLGGLVGAVDGFRIVEEFTGVAGESYFVRFSHGKLVDSDEALAKMDGLKNVTPEE